MKIKILINYHIDRSETYVAWPFRRSKNTIFNMRIVSLKLKKKKEI